MTTDEFKMKQAEMPDLELIELAKKQISELASTGGRSHKMTVPPEVTDTDMVFCELVNRYSKLLGSRREDLIKFACTMYGDEQNTNDPELIKLIDIYLKPCKLKENENT